MDDAASKREVKKEKNLPHLPFKNALVFGRVMRDPDMAKELLERILHIEIDKVVYCNTEQVLNYDVFSRGVRLDLYVKDENRVFNVEMQCGDYAKMGKRMSYYQTRIFSDNAPAIGSNDYEMPETFIVFLCAADPFEYGSPLYEFELSCPQAKDLVLDTGFHWLALNAQAYDRVSDEKLRNVLRYVSSEEVAPGDAFIEKMDAEVRIVNRDEEWMRMAAEFLSHKEYAEWVGYMKGKDEGIAEGRQEGETRFSELINKLLGSDRIDDVKRVATDTAYRETLFKEFGIA